MIIGLHESRIVVTARLDLADLADTPVAADTLEAIKRGNATAVFGAILSEQHTDIEVIALCFTDEARRADLELLDTFVVIDGRWRSLSCDSPQCCLPGGQRRSSPRPALRGGHLRQVERAAQPGRADHCVHAAALLR